MVTNSLYFVAVIALVACLILPYLFSSTHSLRLDKKSLLACQAAFPYKTSTSAECLANADGNSSGCEEEHGITSQQGTDFRTVAIGDIHGSYDGLLEDLFYANVTVSKTKCVWKMQSTPTIVVQMGDYVDRGAGALEALKCMRSLQEKASEFNGEVVRIFGNHELWWLTGVYYKRHKEADTREKVQEAIGILVDDIMTGKMVAARVLHLTSKLGKDIPVLFVHAGYHAKFLKYLTNVALDEKNGVLDPEDIAKYTNKMLVDTVKQCQRYPCDKFTDEVFEAGADRGGDNVGGPLWTDFGTIENDALAGRSPKHFIQVVGHTMAFCYDPRRPNVHPPDSQAECILGLTRPTVDLSAVCVDGGMYLGARTFLEIGTDNHFRGFERRGDEGVVPWKITDFTKDLCGKLII